MLSRGRLPQAIAMLEEAYAAGRTDCAADGYNLLAELSFHCSDIEKAGSWAAKALEIHPDSVTALHLAALAAWSRRDLESASAMVRRCLRVQPDHPGATDLLILMDPHDPAKRRPGTLDKVRRLRRKKGPLSVGIHTRSDRETDPKLRPLWGDHWVKKELEKAFSDLGFDQDPKHPDINIHLFGSPARAYDERAVNLVWLYSHPDMVTVGNLRSFDCIYCASSHFLPKLRAMGYLNIEPMPACTSKSPVNIPLEHDLIFLGNARESRPDGRAIVGDMIRAGLDFKVWGNRWENLLPRANYGGSHWDYRRLAELYASAKITLNDHHPDMEREGFVSNKVFDILASGGFVISGRNRGIAPLFDDAVPEYESAEHLREMVTYYLAHSEERQRLMAKGQRIARTHTYAQRAIQFTRELVS